MNALDFYSANLLSELQSNYPQYITKANSMLGQTDALALPGHTELQLSRAITDLPDYPSSVLRTSLFSEFKVVSFPSIVLFRSSESFRQVNPEALHPES
jgi:hypothetical protein